MGCNYTDRYERMWAIPGSKEYFKELDEALSLVVDEKGADPSDFKWLVGTVHVDDEDNLIY